ncbi:hypothetical protein [Pulveribacter sp.]|uniref:hypothetical protein n=1 Tax=Pulveribacter sp. TaxID=2678893 RepID=UPI0028AD3437|nr:hypothetical protein [Pulveribacter sp.]
MPPPPHPQLLAIVSVDRADRVLCQNPGCGHGVHAAVHVVLEGLQLLVLGSTCYRRRYGQAASSTPVLAGSSWGSGQRLSDDDRALLQHNTAALIERFRARLQDEQQAAAQLAERQRLQDREREQLRREYFAQLQRQAQQQDALRAAQPAVTPAPAPQPHPRALAASPAPLPGVASAPKATGSPWPWQHPHNTSVAVMRDREGQAWVRVQHCNGRHMLTPWPVFEGWEEALPPVCGQANLAVHAYVVPDIVAALRWMTAHGFSAPLVGAWAQVRPASKKP